MRRHFARTGRLLQRWRSDRESRHAQNLGKVVEIVQETARRVRDAIAEDEITLVLGGDCTVGVEIVLQSFNLVPTLTPGENIALPVDLAGAEIQCA